MDAKQCTKCGEVKPIEQFHWNGARRRSECAACSNALDRNRVRRRNKLLTLTASKIDAKIARLKIAIAKKRAVLQHLAANVTRMEAELDHLHDARVHVFRHGRRYTEAEKAAKQRGATISAVPPAAPQAQPGPAPGQDQWFSMPG